MIKTFRSTVRFRTFSLDPVERRLRKMVSIEECRRIAKRRLPRGVFDYIDGAAEDERTAATQRRRRSPGSSSSPRVLRDVSSLDTSTTIFGRPAAMPLILAPTGYTRIADSQGELAVARAAARAGLPYSLSTMGTRSIEEVAAVSDGEKWFQVYTWRDRGLVEELVGRAKAAGYTTLWLTVDTAVLGRRERDVRRGFTLPAEDRAGHARSTARCTRAGRGTSCATTRSRSPTSSGTATRRTARTRSRSPRTSAASSTRRCRGTTSTGCARSGTGRSC